MNNKYLIYIIIFSLVISCSNAQQEKKFEEAQYLDSLAGIKNLYIDKEIDSISCGLNFKPENNYDRTKFEIKKLRDELGNKYKKITDTTTQKIFIDSTMTVFSDILLNKIYPYWFGTSWDFNGHTSKPNQGTIACGYFVSTTLRDMGLNLNRYKLAQQNPENEAKSIAIDTKNRLYFAKKTIFKEISKLEEGLYFVGLDNHVGYLYIKGGTSYFIHSNYIDGRVMIEDITNSPAFISANYYIVKISKNRALIKKWLTKETIKIILK